MKMDENLQLLLKRKREEFTKLQAEKRYAASLKAKARQSKNEALAVWGTVGGIVIIVAGSMFPVISEYGWGLWKGIWIGSNIVISVLFACAIGLFISHDKH